MNLFVASAVAAVLVLYYISQTIVRLVKKKRRFFKKIWNYFGIVRKKNFFRKAYTLLIILY